MHGYKNTSLNIRESIYLEDGTSITHEESVYIDEPIELDIAKMKTDEQLVFGWANVSVDKNGDIPLDWEGDITSPEVLEKAAYQFVLNYRESGEMHEGETTGYMIESVMFTKQKMEAIGIPEGTIPEGWWIGFFIPDIEVVAKIKDGTYNMFSIQGKAKKLKV